jgi:hypothetical protein
MEVPVPDDDTSRIEGRMLELVDGGSTIAGQTPRHALDQGFLDGCGASRVQEVTRTLPAHPVVAGCEVGEVCDVIRQIAELVDHRVRLETDHHVRQR